MGVIEPVDVTPRGAVISPVIIQEQGNKKRMCGDFRALNDHTVSDIYAIPRVDIVIHGITWGPQNLNPRWGERISPDVQYRESKNCLLIITHRGVFRYLRMPFGPKNGPSAFQRLMDRTFEQEILMAG